MYFLIYIYFNVNFESGQSAVRRYLARIAPPESVLDERR